MAEKIKYSVKCSYCEKTYMIENKQEDDFCCPICGGAGTQKDAVKVEEKPDWYGEDMPLPPVEEKTFMEHALGEGAFNGKGLTTILIIALVALLGWLFGM